jgi:hypothetical protein
MAETVIGVFTSVEQAHDALGALINSGFDHDKIGFVTGDPDVRAAVEGAVAKDITTGIEAGIVAGGATGFLFGVTAFAIPVAGPVIAAGTIAATLAGGGLGAIAGSIIGVFTGHGFSPDHSERAAQHVQAGGTIITVQVEPTNAVNARSIIEQNSGTTKVDDIPDAGTLPSDPLEFSSESTGTQLADNPIDEVGASWQSRS